MNLQVDKYGRTKEYRHQEYLKHQAPKDAHIKLFYSLKRKIEYLVSRPAYRKKYQKEIMNNPQKHQKSLQRQRKYANDHRDRKNLLSNIWRAQHADELNYQKRKDYKAHPEKYRKYREDWEKNNPDKVAAAKEKKRSIGRTIPMKTTGAIIRSSIQLDDMLPIELQHKILPRYFELGIKRQESIWHRHDKPVMTEKDIKQSKMLLQLKCFRNLP